MNPTFRAAEPKDLQELTELRILMQCEVNGADSTKISTQWIEEVRNYLQESFENNLYKSFVTELDGRLVSANGVVLYRKPPSLTGPSGWIGEVTNVYTLPEFRGRGYGETTMKMLIDYARARNVVKLHLGTTSDGRKLYERLGFYLPRFTVMDLRL